MFRISVLLDYGQIGRGRLVQRDVAGVAEGEVALGAVDVEADLGAEGFGGGEALFAAEAF